MLSTISAGARALGCSTDHIRRMIKDGRWPYYKLGKKAMRIDTEEIKNLGRLIAEQERGTKKK